jgi:hypothetical protein
MCDQDNRRLVTEGFVNQLNLKSHVQRLDGAFPADGVGDMRTSVFNNLLIVTQDDVPDTINTSRTIEVNGPRIISTLDTVGDQDFFKVELVAGRTYDIGQFLKTGGPSGTPLADAFIELYDATGKLIVSADGGGPNTPSGLDALLTFTAEKSGTYFINARSYDEAAQNGRTGDFVGDYELFVTDVTGKESYKPYYDVNSPLYSLDWGSQVDGTVRNPDGVESGHTTGNPAGTPDNKARRWAISVSRPKARTSSRSTSPRPATSTRPKIRPAPACPRRSSRSAPRTLRSPPCGRHCASSKRLPTSSMSRPRTATRPTSTM